MHQSVSFFEHQHLFDSIFSGIFRIDKLNSCVDGICLLFNGCYVNNGKKIIGTIDKIFWWRSKGLLKKSVTTSDTSDNSFAYL